MMSGKIDWEKDRKLTLKNINGVDFAVDAARNLDSVSAINWDADGNWWDNRRLIADRACDLVQNIRAILKKGDQHYSFNALIIGLNSVKHYQDATTRKRKSMNFEAWRKAYETELSVLAWDWKCMKMDLAFTYTNLAKLAEQRRLFRELSSRTPWQLESVASVN